MNSIVLAVFVVLGVVANSLAEKPTKEEEEYFFNHVICSKNDAVLQRLMECKKTTPEVIKVEIKKCIDEAVPGEEKQVQRQKMCADKSLYEKFYECKSKIDCEALLTDEAEKAKGKETLACFRALCTDVKEGKI